MNCQTCLNKKDDAKKCGKFSRIHQDMKIADPSDPPCAGLFFTPDTMDDVVKMNEGRE